MTPTTGDLINSLFDPRSSGMIIMSYIETPKEVYKHRFDLVIKQMNTINDNFSGDYDMRYFLAIIQFYNLQSCPFTKDEITSLASTIYPDLYKWFVTVDSNPFRQTFIEIHYLMSRIDTPLVLRLACMFLNRCRLRRNYGDRDFIESLEFGLKCNARTESQMYRDPNPCCIIS